jgi:hypothetical protein
VTLAGLLASREWERRAVATGHVTWLVEQITLCNVLLGYVPKDRKDPLIQWVEQHFSTHKFVAFHRSPRIYDAFAPAKPSRHHASPMKPTPKHGGARSTPTTASEWLCRSPSLTIHNARFADLVPMPAGN